MSHWRRGSSKPLHCYLCSCVSLSSQQNFQEFVPFVHILAFAVSAKCADYHKTIKEGLFTIMGLPSLWQCLSLPQTILHLVDLAGRVCNYLLQLKIAVLSDLLECRSSWQVFCLWKIFGPDIQHKAGHIVLYKLTDAKLPPMGKLLLNVLRSISFIMRVERAHNY